MGNYVPEVHARRLRINLWLVAVVALAAGLVALGAWTLVDRYGGSDTEAAQIVDELNAAVNAGDEEALRALFARDAVFVTPGGHEVSGPKNVVNPALTPHSYGYHLERSETVATEGDLATTFAKYEGGVEVGVWQFEDGKIVRMWVYNPGRNVKVP